MCSHSGNYCTPISVPGKGKGDTKAGRNTGGVTWANWHSGHISYTSHCKTRFYSLKWYYTELSFLSIIELYWKFNLYYCFCTTFHNTLEVLHLGSRPLHGIKTQPCSTFAVPLYIYFHFEGCLSPKWLLKTPAIRITLNTVKEKKDFITPLNTLSTICKYYFYFISHWPELSYFDT